VDKAAVSLSLQLAPTSTFFSTFPGHFHPLRLALLQRLLEIGQEGGFLLFVLLQLYERQGFFFQGGVDLGVRRNREREGRREGNEEKESQALGKKRGSEGRRGQRTNKHTGIHRIQREKDVSEGRSISKALTPTDRRMSLPT